MNILGLDRNAGASRADQYVLKQSSKSKMACPCHVKYWCFVYCPLIQLSAKRKKRETPSEKNISWNSSSAWSKLLLHFALKMERVSKKTPFICK